VPEPKPKPPHEFTEDDVDLLQTLLIERRQHLEMDKSIDDVFRSKHMEKLDTLLAKVELLGVPADREITWTTELEKLQVYESRALVEAVREVATQLARQNELLQFGPLASSTGPFGVPIFPGSPDKETPR